MNGTPRVPALPRAANCGKPRPRNPYDRESAMADHGEVEYATASGNDYAEHEGTYQFFLRAVKWSVSVVVAILIGMAIFLT
jgi:hypothetical protein